MSEYYAGIGSRKTPEEVCREMTNHARMLQARNFVLRSGGAAGADSAFIRGTTPKCREIFVPWRGFSVWSDEIVVSNSEILEEAMRIAEHYHPNWRACSDGARLLHSRNVMQVLGADLRTPSSFVVCWTPNGKDVGGTAQAIRIARDKDIRVYNLADEDENLLFLRMINGEFS